VIVSSVRNLRNALDALRSEHLKRDPAAERDDLIARTYELASEAVAINIPEFAAVAALRRAEIEISLQRWESSLASLATARQYIDSLPRHEHGVFLLRMEAQAYAGLQRWDDVRRVCHEGITIVEPSRANVSPLTLQNSYLRFRINLYELAVRAEVELGNWAAALGIAELVKCRSLSRLVAAPSSEGSASDLAREYRTVCEQIDQVVANDGNPDKLLARRRGLWHLLQIARLGGHGATSQSLTVSEVQEALAPDQAVVNYFWMDPARLLVMAIDAVSAEGVCVPVPGKERALLADLAAALQSADPPNSAAELPSMLTELLLPPRIRHVLRGKKRFLVSPHRVLHALPLHALPWEGGFLLEAFAVTYLPNMSALLRPRDTTSRPGVLAIGVSHSKAPPADTFPPLTAADDEVRDIEALYGKDRCRAILDDGATQAALMRLGDGGELSRMGVLHVACHGINIDSDNPMESKLFLRDAALDGLDIATWTTGVRLIVLSACCSGQRPISGRGMSELPGDDLFGLQAAFFAAGAQQIVSTMWPVDSDAARAITLAFHAGMKADAPTEVALQQAVVAFLNAARARDDLMAQRPYVWAPFCLSVCAHN